MRNVFAILQQMSGTMYPPVIFKKGEVLRKVQEENIVEELFREIALL